MFKPFHLKMNAFNVLANDEAVVLKSVERFIDLDKNFATITLPPLTMRFTRNAGPGYYEQLIAKPHYWVTPSDSTKEIKTVIKHNQALLALLNRDKKELAAEARKNAVVLGGTNWMFQIWKRFHFVDMGVVHSLRKFLHHENLHSLMPRERTNDAIEHAEATVNHRIETFSSMLEE